MDKQKVLKAGKIASQIKEYARSIIKPGMPLIEIAEKIESQIIELGGKPAFPVNLSINNIAAHYTPSYDDEISAHGLLKIDFGVHINGWIADTAFSMDLENNNENKSLILSSEQALKNSIKIVKPKIQLSKIGRVIQETIESGGFSPIINLSGHSIEQYELHAGITVPNIDDSKNVSLKSGVYAIEPFSTTGSGKVHDGKPSGIYTLINQKIPRSQTAREVLQFIKKEYDTLPFCSRWIFRKFKVKGLFALKQLEDNNNLHQFSQLLESSNSKISQAEHTILVEENKITVTTE